VLDASLPLSSVPKSQAGIPFISAIKSCSVFRRFCVVASHSQKKTGGKKEQVAFGKYLNQGIFGFWEETPCFCTQLSWPLLPEKCVSTTQFGKRVAQPTGVGLSTAAHLSSVTFFVKHGWDG
jgi:hypothetical protein